MVTVSDGSCIWRRESTTPGILGRLVTEGLPAQTVPTRSSTPFWSPRLRPTDDVSVVVAAVSPGRAARAALP